MNTRWLQQLLNSENQSPNRRRYLSRTGWLSGTASVANVERLESRTLLAGVVEADDPVFGAGALTRDATQGLDFLDLSFTEGRSWQDVTGKFGTGQEFEGFRTALESEVVNLVINAGFTPDPLPGQRVDCDQEDDCLSDLVDLLGPTRTTGLSRTVDGHTGTTTGSEFPSNFRTAIVDSLAGTDNVDIRVSRLPTGGAVPGIATYLVRPSPVTAVTVAGQHIFYNDSFFDFDSDPTTSPFGSGDPAANANDDHAIATDKTPLLPGGTGGFVNYTSYSKGINGIMVDIDGLAGAPTDGDFEFRIGNDDDMANWPLAPAPFGVTVHPSEGDGGSDRVTIIWLDGEIRNTWLPVTVKATVPTGLGDVHVFYYGNAVGESGDRTHGQCVCQFYRPHTDATQPEDVPESGDGQGST